MAGRDLLTFRNHCRTRADQPGADPLWSILAAEADAYIAGDPDVIGTVPEDVSEVESVPLF